MGISKRKDEHIKYALKQNDKINDFDLISLETNSLPNKNIEEIDLSTNYLGFKIPYPFYINAMTGGSLKAKKINDKLSKLANHFNIPLVLGSQSAALKDQSFIHTYSIARENYKGIIVANVSANASLEDARNAIEMIEANALSIHINLIQELVMKEGDRDFSQWENNIKVIVENIDVPVIVKEVGFGMSEETIIKLKNIGVKYIDVSGKGGTNFALIERKRKKDNNTIFDSLGISTVNSLINAQNKGITYYASGGIRNALDIYKALNLGAEAVGLSKYFLNLSKMPLNKAIVEVEKLINDLKKLKLIFD